MSNELSHLDSRGAARMVDVSGKDITVRTATASGHVLTSPEVVALLRGQGMPKGDALAVARIAGIQAAKRTPDLVPLCHPLPLDSVACAIGFEDDALLVETTVRATARTGVEMEALIAATAAALAVYDMCKSIDPGMTLEQVRLEEKTGGTRGDWRRP